MVPPRLGTRLFGNPGHSPLRARYALPRHLVEISHIQPPYIIQRPDTVSSPKDVDAILVQTSRMCSSLRWESLAQYPRLAPPEIHRVEEIHIIVVRWPIAATEDYQFLAHRRACHGSQRHRRRPHDMRHGPMERIGIQNVQLVETGSRIAAAEDVDVGPDERGRMRAKGGVWCAGHGGFGPVHPGGRGDGHVWHVGHVGKLGESSVEIL